MAALYSCHLPQLYQLTKIRVDILMKCYLGSSIEKTYCGYGTITVQDNGQGGREHGHKCDHTFVSTHWFLCGYALRNVLFN